MISVIIAPLLGVWGIQYFLNKKWLWGFGCIAITVTCHFLCIVVKACWPSAISFGIALLSSVQLFGHRKGLPFFKAFTSAPLALQIYWGVMAVIVFFMPQIPYGEMQEFGMY